MKLIEHLLSLNIVRENMNTQERVWVVIEETKKLSKHEQTKKLSNPPTYPKLTHEGGWVGEAEETLTLR